MMHVEQMLWTAGDGWSVTRAGRGRETADLVLYFGAPAALRTPGAVDALTRRYPNAIVTGCSTGGEIHGDDALDGAISATALSFDHTAVTAATAHLDETPDIHMAGAQLGAALKADDLVSVFVLSDGTHVNGSELIRGLRSVLGSAVVITGGLAGDGADFGVTRVGLGDVVRDRMIVAIGFRGRRFRMSHGSCGGWDEFGPERRITRAEGNVLFELDGQPALDLYRRYLGDDAKHLPGSALLFPLRIYRTGEEENFLVRTVVGIDEARQAMIFAGDMPTGHAARLMKGNFDRLVQGAADAAEQALSTAEGDKAGILISCIGRKLLLGQRIGEEVEAVSEVLGGDVCLSGFYSYGEISPHAASGHCELHNQTMTISVLWEE